MIFNQAFIIEENLRSKCRVKLCHGWFLAEEDLLLKYIFHRGGDLAAELDFCWRSHSKAWPMRKTLSSGSSHIRGVSSWVRLGRGRLIYNTGVYVCKQKKHDWYSQGRHIIKSVASITWIKYIVLFHFSNLSFFCVVNYGVLYVGGQFQNHRSCCDVISNMLLYGCIICLPGCLYIYRPIHTLSIRKE
jgi:hypothetical protein